MSNDGELIDDNTIEFVRLLPGPVERIWEYLTDSDKRAQWFAGGPMDNFSGGKVEFQFNHNRLSPTQDPIPEKYSDMEGGMTSIADILTFDPPHLLVIGWEGGEISFRLEEQNDQVKLTLTHSNLPTDRDKKVGTMAGWHTHLNILVDRAYERDPKGFWSVHESMENKYVEIFLIN